MKIYDVSLTLKEGMVVFPGNRGFHREVSKSFEGGASCEESVLSMGSHVGTHIDAPAHMIQGGRRLDEIALESFIGPALVVDMRTIEEAHIDARHLKQHDLGGVERILFHTRNSEHWAAGLTSFDEDFVALTGDAVEILVGKGVKLVGVDGLSVDRFHSGSHPAHIPLLRAGIVIVEGLNLHEVPAGRYQIFCGPLKVANGDGAPTRVFLIQL